MTDKEIEKLDALSKEIIKKRNADERMMKSRNNDRTTSRTFYEGKVSAFNIILKLIEDIKTKSYKEEWLDLL